MKTIKIIDLLIMVANNEELPKKIKYQFKTFELKNNEIYLRTDKVIGNDYGVKSLLEYILDCDLNDEVEIIEEEKEMKKLDYCKENTFSNMKESTYLSSKERRLLDSNFKMIKEKFDELIDTVNELKRGN